MRIHLAVCARQSQVGVAQTFSLCAAALCLLIMPQSAVTRQKGQVEPSRAGAGKPRTASDKEAAALAVILDEYQRWRELERTDAHASRERVQLAAESVSRDARPTALVNMREICSAVQAGNCNRARLRGLLVLRTLETVIDRERVDRALALYNERNNKGQSAGMPALQKACEEVSNRPLGWFFDYYFRGTLLPEITLRRIAAGAPNEVAGEIAITNVPEDFQVRVELRLYTPGGVLNHSVATKGSVTPFTVTSNDPVTNITLDPDKRILRKLPVNP